MSHLLKKLLASSLSRPQTLPVSRFSVSSTPESGIPYEAFLARCRDAVVNPVVRGGKYQGFVWHEVSPDKVHEIGLSYAETDFGAGLYLKVVTDFVRDTTLAGAYMSRDAHGNVKIDVTTVCPEIFQTPPLAPDDVLVALFACNEMR